LRFFSCPNLLNEAYTAKLNQQLAAKVLSTINENTITANKIEISKIFDFR
jgi:hypothetical protein